MTEQSMLERAARALCEADGQDPNITSGAKNTQMPLWHFYINKARAVLLAIREPNTRMHNAGAFSDGQSKPSSLSVDEETGTVRLVGYNCANPTVIFQAMIDEALK